jgi:hypothetical protein
MEPSAGAQIEWQWAEGVPGHGRAAALAVPDGRFVFARHQGGGAVDLRRLDAAGRRVWREELRPSAADSAAMLLDSDTLYAALYSELATGGQVVALDARSGTPRWTTELIALGPLHHGKYRNRVQLRLLGGRLVVFGDEAGGRYVEVLDPATGRRLAHRRLEG